MEGIKNADFVIADLTLERPNVYLEVGYAWGLQRPVILLAREGQRLHFDLSHHKCLFYKTIGKLADSLEKTITEMFGPGQGSGEGGGRGGGGARSGS
jgi:nucleoside 2-deoxyribosyltransferase